VSVFEAEKQNGASKVSFNEQAKAIRHELQRLAGLFEPEAMIERGGAKIRLPEGMDEVQAIKFLKRVYDESQAEATWHRQYRYRPLDGAAATMRVLKRTFGGVSVPPGMGFFGPIPPAFISIEVGPNERIEVPAMGEEVTLPHLSDVTFTLDASGHEEYGHVFTLHARGKKASAGEVQAIFELVAQELEENSIYRGKAIHDGYGFLDLDGFDPDKVVYSEVTQGELETNIFARLWYPDELTRYGQRLKGAVLLEGTYGVGKTLAAYMTAIEAIKAGWTFILMRPESITGQSSVEAFRKVMQDAEMYERAVVFVEDVDTLTAADAESDRISIMLDLFDGVRAKGREVVVILTTNHVESIHKGMVRPGRIDAVIPVTKPDAAGIIKLCKVLVPEELLSEEISDEEWEMVAKAMDGFIPAAVAEACERAVRYMIVKAKGEVNGTRIDALDLARAAEGLSGQMQLLEDAKDLPERETLTMALRSAVEEAVHEVVDTRFGEHGSGHGPNVSVAIPRS
jgi:transitional endoplasmic reticulum ATPase